MELKQDKDIRITVLPNRRGFNSSDDWPWGESQKISDDYYIVGFDINLPNIEFTREVTATDIRINQVHEIVFMRATVKEREVQRANKKRRKKR
jgi:hypothetical protein